jgi:hypothetical protein
MSDAWEEAGLPDPEIPRDDIRAIKQEIMQAPGGLNEATKRLQQPYYRQFAHLHPKTRTLHRVWTFLGFFNLACLTVFPIILFFLTRWYWALAPIVLNFFLVQPIHNWINLEVFARITYIQLRVIDVAEED